MSGLFHRILQNFGRVFKGWNLLWHFIAFGLTYILVHWGVDWRYFNFWQSSRFEFLLFPAVILGFFVPVFIPAIMFIVGYIKNSSKILNTACAITQAAFLGWFLSVCYKALTGRSGPPGDLSAIKAIDVSHIFKFGFYRSGIFWGWPSSHTTTAFAVGVVIFVMYSENKFIKYLALIYTIYIGFGVSTNIH